MSGQSGDLAAPPAMVALKWRRELARTLRRRMEVLTVTDRDPFLKAATQTHVVSQKKDLLISRWKQLAARQRDNCISSLVCLMSTAYRKSLNVSFKNVKL